VRAAELQDRLAIGGEISSYIPAPAKPHPLRKFDLVIAHPWVIGASRSRKGDGNRMKRGLLAGMPVFN
jgi:hypothetical protein